MLLDTCVVIDFLRGNRAAHQFLTGLTEKPSVSVVTVAEIFAGLSSQCSEHAARGFLAACQTRVLSPIIAEAAGQHLRHFRASHGTDFPDAVIAATAQHYGLPLATLNVRHFPMIKQLKAAY